MPKRKNESKLWHLATYFIGLIFLLGLIFISFRNPQGQGGNDLRRMLLKNKFVEALLPTYHALRKLPDIFFFPYRLTKSNLPTYNLEIDPGKLVELNAGLPEDPMSGQLYNEDRKYVKATFRYGDYEDEVKIRYRGTSAHHWNSYQKSLRIKFPDGHLFQGMKVLDLIIPYDRKYFVEALNFYRAKKFGLTTLDFFYSRLTLNGQDMGVYLTLENWSNSWFEKRPLPLMSVYAEDDGRNPNSQVTDSAAAKGKVMFSVNGKEFYLNEYSGVRQEGSLEAFMEIVENADDKTFKKVIGNIFDMKKFYGWNVMNILAASGHYSEFGNLFIMFNPVTGKFEMSPWDPDFGTLGNDFQDKRIKLVRRILSVPEFREERNKILSAYIQNEQNLQDDLTFFNKLYRETRNDFFTDSAKLYNNIQFLRQISLYRKTIQDNFNNAAFILDYDTNHYYDKADRENTKPASKLQWKGSFERFLETGYSIDEFVNQNPRFIKTGENKIVLPAWAYIFSEDVIIPPGLEVGIEPGVTAYMGKGVSILSYSPIIARGTVYSPIKFTRANLEDPWGSLAVVNAGGDQSVFNFVEFNGGFGDIINGMTFTGQASFFSSDVEIDNSIFKNAGDDDSLNVKYGKAIIQNSFWTGNAYDSIDLDFSAEGTIIKDSKFYANNARKEVEGDGIDISWSKVTLEGNDINGCSDKGISIGENSSPVVIRNTIQNCLVGIAVKDLSVAEIIDNIIKRVETGISAYRKKEVFGGGTANVVGGRMEDVKMDYKKDQFSQINLK